MCVLAWPLALAGAQDPPRSVEALEALVAEGRYGEASAAARAALSSLDGDEARRARVMDVLVEALWRSGRAREAETFELAERAVAMKEARGGTDPTGLARSLDNLGVLMLLTGQYEPARETLERALAVVESSLPPDHPQLATVLNHLAPVLQNLGEYSSALPHYERALRIQEKALGPEHADVAKTLNNLATLLKDMGDYRSAWPLYERSLTIVERDLGPEHPLAGIGRSNLGELMHRLQRLPRAKALYLSALDIKEKTLGAEHPSLATTLNNLGELHRDEGQDALARPLYERAIEIQTASLGSEHPDLALSLSNLGGWLLRSGDVEASRSYFERARAIREAALGRDHPLVADVLFKLAFVYRAQGRVEEALTTTLRAEEVSREHVRLTARVLPERQALAYAWERISGLDLALGLASADGVSDGPGRVWDAVVRSRALVLDEMAARHRSLRDARGRGLRKAHRRASERLANLLVRGPADRSVEAYRRQLDEARREKETAERELAGRSAAFRRELDRRQTGFSDVTRALPDGSAMVAYVRYGHRARDPEPGAPAYLAFVLSRGRAQPAIVELGPARSIDDAVRRWRNEVTGGLAFPGRTPSQSEARVLDAALDLRRKIWDPLPEELRRAHRVFIVPDGALHLVNFAALPDRDGDGYLVEAGPSLHYLSAERDLAAVEPARLDAAPKDLLVVGGADFEDTSLFAALRGSGSSSSILDSIGEMLSAYSPFRGTLASCEAFRRHRFPPLPDSAREAETVARLWREERAENGGSVLHLSGRSASEAVFKRTAPRYRWIHVATHGFFLGTACESALSGPGGRASAIPRGDNPLLLSGLALSGANHRDSAGEQEEDGILTAQEVGSLDLSGVEWVVLSGCDTGVGEVREGEGVLGLRRAFRVAGVGTLIMSLWPVADDAARAWMTSLYRARLESDSDTAAAMAEAARTVIRERRKAGESTHPFYWAAFVAAGNWK